MSISMRAKMKLSFVAHTESYDRLEFNAVSKPMGYQADGLDEDNTYATYTPSARLTMAVTNPALVGKFNQGEVYYVDFTPAS